MLPDKDSPNTSTAKSSRRDSLNERVVNLPYSEPELIHHTQPQHNQSLLQQQYFQQQMQYPPQNLQLQQELKQELPVRNSK